MSLATNLQDAMTRIATEIKAVRTLVNGNAADLSSLNTTAKANLVAAINELQSSIAGASGINDAAPATTTSYSSQKTVDLLATLKTEILGGASSAYDTLQEIQSLMEADDTETSGILTALGNRVRVDAAQTFTAPQQAQGRDNIGAAAAADLTTLSTNVGNTATNFVTTFEAGLV